MRYQSGTRQRKIAWKPEATPARLEPTVFPYIPDSTSPEEMEARVPYLKKGSLWVTRVTLWEDSRFNPNNYVPHEFEYLTSSLYGNLTRRMTLPKKFHEGSVAIHMGSTYVSELPWSSLHVSPRRVHRHMFLVEGTIYFSSNLCDFLPIF